MLTRLLGWWTTFRFRHIVLELLVSVCLAYLIWLYMHNRSRSSVDHVSIPVQVALAAHQRDQFSLEAANPTHVVVSFNGPNSRMRDLKRKLQKGTVQAARVIAVPDDKQGEAMYREQLRLRPEDVLVPPGVVVEFAEENVMAPVTVHRLVERQLPVKLEYAGEARLTQVKLEPPTVLVRGPKSVLDRATHLPTQAYSTAAGAEATGTELRDNVLLASELGGRPVQTNPKQVQIRFKAEPKQKVYKLAEVPVHFLCPMNFAWKPRFANDQDGKVLLKVRGPVTEQLPPVLAFIDLTGASVARGRNLAPLRLQLPKDFELAQPQPPLVSFLLDDSVTATPVGRVLTEP